MDATKPPAIDAEPIQLKQPSYSGLYVAGFASPERIAKPGIKVAHCNRCKALVVHWPRQSAGHEIICLLCAQDVPAIARHLDELAKTHG